MRNTFFEDLFNYPPNREPVDPEKFKCKKFPDIPTDPFLALGLDKSASENEILDAYRNLVKMCHPDRFNNEEQYLKDEAKEWLNALAEAKNIALQINKEFYFQHVYYRFYPVLDNNLRLKKPSPLVDFYDDYKKSKNPATPNFDRHKRIEFPIPSAIPPALTNQKENEKVDAGVAQPQVASVLGVDEETIKPNTPSGIEMKAELENILSQLKTDIKGANSFKDLIEGLKKLPTDFKFSIQLPRSSKTYLRDTATLLEDFKNIALDLKCFYKYITSTFEKNIPEGYGLREKAREIYIRETETLEQIDFDKISTDDVYKLSCVKDGLSYEYSLKKRADGTLWLFDQDGTECDEVRSMSGLQLFYQLPTGQATYDVISIKKELKDPKYPQDSEGIIGDVSDDATKVGSDDLKLSQHRVGGEQLDVSPEDALIEMKIKLETNISLAHSFDELVAALDTFTKDTKPIDTSSLSSESVFTPAVILENLKKIIEDPRCFYQYKDLIPEDCGLRQKAREIYIKKTYTRENVYFDHVYIDKERDELEGSRYEIFVVKDGIFSEYFLKVSSLDNGKKLEPYFLDKDGNQYDIKGPSSFSLFETCTIGIHEYTIIGIKKERKPLPGPQDPAEKKDIGVDQSAEFKALFKYRKSANTAGDTVEPLGVDDKPVSSVDAPEPIGVVEKPVNTETSEEFEERIKKTASFAQLIECITSSPAHIFSVERRNEVSEEIEEFMDKEDVESFDKVGLVYGIKDKVRELYASEQGMELELKPSEMEDGDEYNVDIFWNKNYPRLTINILKIDGKLYFKIINPSFGDYDIKIPPEEIGLFEWSDFIIFNGITNDTLELDILSIKKINSNQTPPIAPTPGVPSPEQPPAGNNSRPAGNSGQNATPSPESPAEKESRLEKGVDDARSEYVRLLVAHKEKVYEDKNKLKKLWSKLGMESDKQKTKDEEQKSQELIEAEAKYMDAKKERAGNLFAKNKEAATHERTKSSAIGVDQFNEELLKHSEIEWDRLQEEILSTTTSEKESGRAMGFLKKARGRWQKLPFAYRMTALPILFGAGLYATTSVGLVAATSYAGMRVARGVVGFGASSATSATLGAVIGGRNMFKIGDEKKSYATNINEQNFGDKEKEMSRFFEKMEDKKKRDKVRIAVSMLLAGGATAMLSGNYVKAHGFGHVDSELPNKNGGGKVVIDKPSSSPGFIDGLRNKFNSRFYGDIDKPSLPLTPPPPSPSVLSSLLTPSTPKITTEVSLSNRGFIQTIQDLKEKTLKQYESVEKMPSSVKSFYEGNSTKQSIDYGMYDPKTGKSGMGFVGEKLILDENGELKYSDLGGHTEMIEKTQAGKFSAQHADRMMDVRPKTPAPEPILDPDINPNLEIEVKIPETLPIYQDDDSLTYGTDGTHQTEPFATRVSNATDIASRTNEVSSYIHHSNAGGFEYKIIPNGAQGGYDYVSEEIFKGGNKLKFAHLIKNTENDPGQLVLDERIQDLKSGAKYRSEFVDLQEKFLKDHPFGDSKLTKEIPFDGGKMHFVKEPYGLDGKPQTGATSVYLNGHEIARAGNNNVIKLLPKYQHSAVWRIFNADTVYERAMKTMKRVAVKTQDLGNYKFK